MLQTEAWTYDTLAECSRKQLEQILLTGTAPDPEELEGYIYCGWNHEWVGTLSGRKFKKGFYEGKPRVAEGPSPFIQGYNVVVRQNGIGAPYTARQKSCPQRSQRSSRS